MNQPQGDTLAFTLPELPYAYTDLEKSIDAKTMEIHHTKHHQTYVTKLNEAVGETSQSLEEVIRSNVDKPAIRNNGGGHWNHSLFWTLMSPNGGGEPSGKLADLMKKSFGSFSEFQEAFKKEALGRFGSGWAWLCKEGGALRIFSTANQDPAFLETDGPVLLGLDVWEHAYYLRYQNKRPDYVDAWWDVVDWQSVSDRM